MIIMRERMGEGETERRGDGETGRKKYMFEKLYKP